MNLPLGTGIRLLSHQSQAGKTDGEITLTVEVDIL
jgi:hypothetical protein